MSDATMKQTDILSRMDDSKITMLPETKNKSLEELSIEEAETTNAAIAKAA